MPQFIGFPPTTVVVTIMQFSLYGVSPITLVLQGTFRPEILTVSPEWGVRQGRGVKNKPFSSL